MIVSFSVIWSPGERAGLGHVEPGGPLGCPYGAIQRVADCPDCAGGGGVQLHLTEAVLKVCGTCPGRAHSVQRRGSGSGWQGVVGIATLRAFMPDSLHILMQWEEISIVRERALEL